MSNQATAARLAPADGHLLVSLTLDNLRRTFESGKQHRPSPAMWDALRDIAATLAKMADGEALPKVYLSSLDPGVGKSSTVAAFIDALLSQAHYRDVGVIVCVPRLEAIAEFDATGRMVGGLVHDAGIPREMLAVYTASAPHNALSGAEIDKAQVLLTTQQMVERRTVQSGTFTKCAAFFYQGKPRAVRIWDEAFMPAEGVTVSRGEVNYLHGALMMRGMAKVANALEDLSLHVKMLPTGAREEVPELSEIIGLNELLGALGDQPHSPTEARATDKLREIAAGLWFMSGRTIAIRSDGPHHGNALLTYRNTLPADLAPLLVLDASGRVRETYNEMEQHRGNLVRLRGAIKKYDRVTLHVWETASGKGAFAKGESQAHRLMDGITETIKAKPAEPWLVVHHLPSHRVIDVAEALRARLGGEIAERVSFVTWGRHTAVNNYRNVPNIILAGVLYLRASQAEAKGRSAADLAPEAGDYNGDRLRRLELGEARDAVLQAACRGELRCCDGDQAHRSDVYIIASNGKGVPQSLPEIFPGAKVERWRPVERKLTGHVKAAFEYITARLTGGAELVKFSEVQKHLAMRSQHFTNDVRKHPEFIGAIADAGLVEWGERVRFTAFCTAAHAYGFKAEGSQPTSTKNP